MDKRLTPGAFSHVAGIYDAQAFTVGESNLVHRPAHYPTANKVVATYGQYGYGIDHDSRIAYWSSGYEAPPLPKCPRCWEH